MPANTAGIFLLYFHQGLNNPLTPFFKQELYVNLIFCSEPRIRLVTALALTHLVLLGEWVAETQRLSLLAWLSPYAYLHST